MSARSNRRTLLTLGIESPTDLFPANAFDEVNQKVSRRTSSTNAAWHAFSLAWNGIAYRFVAAIEYAGLFSGSIRINDAPPPDERCRQENALFFCISSLQSTVECTFFASRIVASISSPDGFSLRSDHDLKFMPKDVVEYLAERWPNGKICNVLRNAQSSHEFIRICDLRRVLFHRGSPPRQIFFSTGPIVESAALPLNPSLPADQWRYDFELTPSALDPMVAWVDSHIEEAIMALDEFTTSW